MPSSTKNSSPWPRRTDSPERHVLEQALQFYLRNVVPSQHLVRWEVMDAFEQSALFSPFALL